jgi:hypothetical protein
MPLTGEAFETAYSHKSLKILLSTPGNVADRPLHIYLLIAFGITWRVGGLALLAGDIRPGGASQLHPLHILAAFGPSIAGVVMAASTDGSVGVRRLLARVSRAAPLCHGTSPS